MMNRFLVVPCASVWMLAGVLPAVGQQSMQSPPPMTSTSATDMALNSETGTIDEMLTADDGGYHWLGYIVRWNGQRVFVPDVKHEVHLVGKPIAFTATKSTVGSGRVLRFTLVRPEEEIDPSINEAKAAEASITLGTASVEEALSSESMGYKFVAYIVSWHDKRVVVVDRKSASKYAAGDKIDFKVLRAVNGTDQQLAFILADTPK